jgi:hypothetical protein
LGDVQLVIEIKKWNGTTHVKENAKISPHSKKDEMENQIKR